MTPEQTIERLNAAWRDAQPGTIAAAIRGFFTEDVVVVGPNLQRVASGADAVARSYDDFASSAKILEARIGDPIVDEFASVAVATMPWSMTYEYEGKRASEAGYEVYVLRREGEDWKICWRQMVSNPG